jgi:hypothetical protein
MKKTALLFVVVAMIGCNNASNEASTTPPADTAATAAPKEETPPPPAMDSAAMMKKWQECMTPGEMHKWMASMNGKWTTEGKFWMDEKAPPTESKGTCENKMVLNGLYQESVHKSMMMGMPFEGHGTLAYDNHRKVFISTWIDNMGSSIMVLEGAFDDASKTLTLTGAWDDPIKGKMDIKQTCKVIDDKTQMMEMWGIQGGKEMKWMEMKLTKK